MLQIFLECKSVSYPTDDAMTPLRGITVQLGASDGQPVSFNVINISNDGSNHQDTLISIERIVGSDLDDTIEIKSFDADQLKNIQYIDLAGNPETVSDKVDLSTVQTAVEADIIGANDQTVRDKATGTVLNVRNVEGIKTSSGAFDDVVKVGTNSTYYIDTGACNDHRSGGGRTQTASGYIGRNIIAGAGADTIDHVGEGAFVDVGDDSDVDTVVLGGNAEVTNVKSNDRIAYNGYLIGGLTYGYAESAWVLGSNGVKYGLNELGQLVINVGDGVMELFVDNYTGGPGISNPTAGITLARVIQSACRLLDEDMPFLGSIVSALPDQLKKQ